MTSLSSSRICAQISQVKDLEIQEIEVLPPVVPCVSVLKPKVMNSKDLRVFFDASLIITKPYIRTTTEYQEHLKKIIKTDPNNLQFRNQSSFNSIKMANIFKNLQKQCRVEDNSLKMAAKAEGFLRISKSENLTTKKIDPFNAFHYYMKAVIQEYEGIDCQNFVQVKEYIKNLLLAQTLDPKSKEISDMLDKAINFLHTAWNELVSEGTIESPTAEKWGKELEEVLAQDPLKELFLRDPTLFQFSDLEKYRGFFTQHPQLASREAFVKKHPELTQIQLQDDTLSEDNLREALTSAAEHPFLNTIFLLSGSSQRSPLLTPGMASVLKEGMLFFQGKGKCLTVYLKSSRDVFALMSSFVMDGSLSKENGSIGQQVVAIPKGTGIIQAIRVSIDEPFVKTGTQLVKKADS